MEDAPSGLSGVAATDPQRDALFEAAGRAIVALVRAGMRPSDLLTDLLTDTRREVIPYLVEAIGPVAALFIDFAQGRVPS